MVYFECEEIISYCTVLKNSIETPTLEEMNIKKERSNGLSAIMLAYYYLLLLAYCSDVLHRLAIKPVVTLKHSENRICSFY